MNRNLSVYAALAFCLSSMTVPASNAGELDKKTTITVSQAIVVQDTVLPAGHYVLRLLNPSTSRDVVEILNGDETRLITTLLAIPAYRFDPAGEVNLSFTKSEAKNSRRCTPGFIPATISVLSFGNQGAQPQPRRVRPPTRPGSRNRSGRGQDVRGAGTPSQPGGLP